MKTLHLYNRLTWKYVDSCRDMDEHRYIGSVKMLGGTKIAEGNDYDIGDTWKFRIVAPSTLKNVNLASALRSTLSHHGCHHDYDCCGCASVSAIVRRVNKREYFVSLHTSYNY